MTTQMFLFKRNKEEKAIEIREIKIWNHWAKQWCPLGL